MFLGSEADIAGAKKLRPVDPARLQFVDPDPVPVLGQVVQGLFRVASEIPLGRVGDDQAGEQVAGRGGDEAVDVRLLDHMGRCIKLALDGGISGPVGQGSPRGRSQYLHCSIPVPWPMWRRARLRNSIVSGCRRVRGRRERDARNSRPSRVHSARRRDTLLTIHQAASFKRPLNCWFSRVENTRFRCA